MKIIIEVDDTGIGSYQINNQEPEKCTLISIGQNFGRNAIECFQGNRIDLVLKLQIQRLKPPSPLNTNKSYENPPNKTINKENKTGD